MNYTNLSKIMLMADLNQLPSIAPGLFLFNIHNGLLGGGRSNPIMNLSKIVHTFQT
jgi:hypothetical protein